ncbi:hypothetical protein BDP27DRAFT_1424825 [Rhodocollybia butyracea]|uniref:COG complex component COG2 C-terminal domain-containing protein n=1 Tax=Rhodocollybia butyracea TaxID=206335 RepID=A0A9P5PLI9_9AGAR|nr:hypothetical protein BDP27DRAFT_1424825 [Rhodocollybia butyracea]
MEVDLGGVVFAAGRPDEFLKGAAFSGISWFRILTKIMQSYEITQAFIRSLELMAPSAQAVESLRAHPVYTIFEKRWQLPVYFQMRRKKIVSERSPTPALGERPSVEAFSSEEATLHKYVALIADLKTLLSSTTTLWNEEISMMLPEPDEIEEELTPQDALENISLAISALIVPMSSTVVLILIERDVSFLKRGQEDSHRSEGKDKQAAANGTASLGIIDSSTSQSLLWNNWK